MIHDTRAGAPGSWRLAMQSPRFAVSAIVLLWACAFLPGLGVRDLRLEEGRRATPAAEMYQTGDYIVPRLYGQPYLNKPPLFFWMAAGVGHLQGGVNELSVRIPSALSVLGGALLLLYFGRRQLPLETRALAAIMFLSMPFMLDKGTLGEIDAVLSFLTFAAVAVLWDAWDADRGRFALRGWIGCGIVMAAVTMTKGPGGVVEFYAMLVPFLLFSGRRRWLQIFSMGHILMLVIALAPAVVWVVTVCQRSHMGLEDLIRLWRGQTGLNTALSGDAGDRLGRYAVFPFRVFSVLLPWGLLLIPPLWRPFGRRYVFSDKADRPGFRDLWMLLVPAVPAITIVFWAWPSGKPRYAMMAVYPAATLAAITLTALAARVRWPQILPLFKAVTQFLPPVAIGGSLVALGVALIKVHQAIATTAIVAVGAITVGMIALRLSRRLPLFATPATSAIAIAAMMLLGRGLIAAVLFPHLAPRDATTLLHQQISTLIPTGTPVYTTRTIASGRGDYYYNMQFYFPDVTTPDGFFPRALARFSDLPAGRTVTVVLATEEWDKLVAIAPDAIKLGTLFTKNGPPALIVAQVTRPSTTRPPD